MAFVIVLVVLAAAVFVISAPLRAVRKPGQPEVVSPVPDLRAARVAKYAEIREAELDHRTGKLSDEDYEAVDTALRAEAIEILRQLDETEPRTATIADP
jgi:biopolymer transport protein ExbB/TolQ